MLKFDDLFKKYREPIAKYISTINYPDGSYDLISQVDSNKKVVVKAEVLVFYGNEIFMINNELPVVSVDTTKKTISESIREIFKKKYKLDLDYVYYTNISYKTDKDDSTIFKNYDNIITFVYIADVNSSTSDFGPIINTNLSKYQRDAVIYHNLAAYHILDIADLIANINKFKYGYIKNHKMKLINFDDYKTYYPKDFIFNKVGIDFDYVEYIGLILNKLFEYKPTTNKLKSGEYCLYFIQFENDDKKRCFLGYILSAIKSLNDGKRQKILADYLAYIHRT